jgi:hypothetical protein
VVIGIERESWLDLIVSLAIVAAIGLIAIGASGAVAAGLGDRLGAQFVAGDPPDRLYTADRCADFAEYHPEAADCRAAAAAHHFDEVVEYRMALGILGVLGLGVVLLARWRVPLLVSHEVLPASFAPTVGASLFGMAAVVLLGSSVPSLLLGNPDGVGQLLSGGVVSLVVFLGFAARLRRTLILRRA